MFFNKSKIVRAFCVVKSFTKQRMCLQVARVYKYGKRGINSYSSPSVVGCIPNVAAAYFDDELVSSFWLPAQNSCKNIECDHELQQT